MLKTLERLLDRFQVFTTGVLAGIKRDPGGWRFAVEDELHATVTEALSKKKES